MHAYKNMLCFFFFDGLVKSTVHISSLTLQWSKHYREIAVEANCHSVGLAPAVAHSAGAGCGVGGYSCCLLAQRGRGETEERTAERKN